MEKTQACHISFEREKVKQSGVSNHILMIRAVKRNIFSRRNNRIFFGVRFKIDRSTLPAAVVINNECVPTNSEMPSTGASYL